MRFGKRTMVGIVVGVLALCAVAFFIVQSQNATPERGVALSKFLNESDFEGSEDDWIESLTDEQKAAIDIAFETNVANGYSGSKDDWIASNLLARYDGNGDIVVMLPDGGDFTVRRNKEAGSETAQEVDLAASESTSGTAVIVDEVHCLAGDQDVMVPIRIVNNPGILGMTLSVSYNESALLLKSVENGSAFQDALSFTHSKELGTGCRYIWDGIELSSDDVKDGVILKLFFDVVQDAENGIYPIVVRTDDSAVNNDLGEVVLSVQDGKVVVG